MSIQSANVRQSIYDACVSEQSTQQWLDDQEAAQLAAVEDHYARVIARWCNADDTSPEAVTSNISLDIIDTVSSDWANAQTSLLTTAGYVVDQDATFFTVSLP